MFHLRTPRVYQIGTMLKWDEEALARHRQELEDLIAAVHRKEEQVRTRSIRRYEAALRVLRGNPTAKAREELGEAFESLRKLLER